MKSRGYGIMKKASPDLQMIHRIGEMVRAARRHRGMNQVLVAPKLGLDQSALSRVESGKQMLTASQWFAFCELVGISLESPALGYFEFKQTESAVALPKRYAFEKRTRVRALLPMLEYAKNTLGESAVDSFLRRVKINPDFFVNLNAAINFNFTLDLVGEILAKGRPGAKEAAMASRTVLEKHTHGSLHFYYDFVANDQLSVVHAYLRSARSYHSNLEYRVLSSNSRNIELAVTQCDHIRQFNVASDPKIAEFLCNYEKGLIENFSSYGGRRPATVTGRENPFREAGPCVFKVRLTSS